MEFIIISVIAYLIVFLAEKIIFKYKRIKDFNNDILRFKMKKLYAEYFTHFVQEFERQSASKKTIEMLEYLRTTGQINEKYDILKRKGDIMYGN